MASPVEQQLVLVLAKLEDVRVRLEALERVVSDIQAAVINAQTNS